MPTTESQKKATAKYKKANIRRVALEMQKSEYDLLKTHADAQKKTVNGYLKEAMREKMRKEDAQDV